MQTKSNRQFGVILILIVAVAGCREPVPEPSVLGEQMRREMQLAAPTVGGPSHEFTAAAEPARLAEVAVEALQEAGVRLVQEGSTDAGRWLPGRSLADRSVLVQILPIYPGRSTVKVTVEGADTLTRELLNRLATNIGKRTR
ncbi:MAG: hypothetical protein FJ280_05355 [Planctomycetes bacterium]|nr:hypothetical protein [Planctomycetota bacterium]